MVVLVKKDSCITYRGFWMQASDTSPSPWAAISPISVLSLLLPSVVTTADTPTSQYTVDLSRLMMISSKTTMLTQSLRKQHVFTHVTTALYNIGKHFP